MESVKKCKVSSGLTYIPHVSKTDKGTSYTQHAKVQAPIFEFTKNSAVRSTECHFVPLHIQVHLQTYIKENTELTN